MNQLEKWRDRGLIDITISETAQREAASGDSQRAAKAYRWVFSMSEDNTEEEVLRKDHIEHILFPDGAKGQNQRNDIDIVFNASKYGRILAGKEGSEP